MERRFYDNPHPNWRLRSKDRVWGRPWVIVEVEEHITGQPVEWFPYYVDKLEWRPATTNEAERLLACQHQSKR